MTSPLPLRFAAFSPNMIHLHLLPPACTDWTRTGDRWGTKRRLTSKFAVSRLQDCPDLPRPQELAQSTLTTSFHRLGYFLEGMLYFTCQLAQISRHEKNNNAGRWLEGCSSSLATYKPLLAPENCQWQFAWLVLCYSCSGKAWAGIDIVRQSPSIRRHFFIGQCHCKKNSLLWWDS